MHLFCEYSTDQSGVLSHVMWDKELNEDSNEESEEDMVVRYITYTAAGALGPKAMKPCDFTQDYSKNSRLLSWEREAKVRLKSIKMDTEKYKINFIHTWVNKQGDFFESKSEGRLVSEAV